MPFGSPAFKKPSKKAYISGNNTMAVIAIARASLKPIKIEQLIRNNKEEVKQIKQACEEANI